MARGGRRFAGRLPMPRGPLGKIGMYSLFTMQRLGFLNPLITDWAAALSNVAVPQYLGNVATRCWCPAETGSGATREQMSRMITFARDDITSLQCVFPNWYWDGVFHLSGGPLLIEACIEYPIGVTSTRLLFSGINQGSIPDGTNLLTDALAIVIPRGAQFAVRSWTHSDFSYIRRGLWQGFAGDSSITSGANLTTANLVTGIAGGFGGNTTMYGPVAVVAQTTKPSFFLIGDSIAAGTTDVGGGPSGDFGILAESLGPYTAYSSMAVSGLRALNVVADSAMHVTLGNYHSHIATNLGTNDLVASARTVPQLIADLNTIIALYPGKPFYAMSLIPRTTGSWATYAGQALLAQEASIESISATILAKGLTGQAGAFDPRTPLMATLDDGSLPVSNSGRWIYSPVLTADGVHPNHTGNLLIKNGARVFA